MGYGQQTAEHGQGSEYGPESRQYQSDHIQQIGSTQESGGIHSTNNKYTPPPSKKPVSKGHKQPSKEYKKKPFKAQKSAKPQKSVKPQPTQQPLRYDQPMQTLSHQPQAFNLPQMHGYQQPPQMHQPQMQPPQTHQQPLYSSVTK